MPHLFQYKFIILANVKIVNTTLNKYLLKQTRYLFLKYKIIFGKDFKNYTTLANNMCQLQKKVLTFIQANTN